MTLLLPSEFQRLNQGLETGNDGGVAGAKTQFLRGNYSLFSTIGQICFQGDVHNSFLLILA